MNSFEVPFKWRLSFFSFMYYRSTYDASSPRGYIDLFIKAQDENLGKFFTNQDLLIGCQVSLLYHLLSATHFSKPHIFVQAERWWIRWMEEGVAKDVVGCREDAVSWFRGEACWSVQDGAEVAGDVVPKKWLDIPIHCLFIFQSNDIWQCSIIQ